MSSKYVEYSLELYGKYKDSPSTPTRDEYIELYRLLKEEKEDE